MNPKILVTDIVSVFTVQSKFTPKVRDYSGKVYHNELIIKLEGQTETRFDKKVFLDKKGSVRFLPAKNTPVEYTCRTLEEGYCIDIQFDTNLPFENMAFLVFPRRYDDLSRLFRKAEKTWREKRNGYFHTTLACLYEILGILQSEEEYVPNDLFEKIRPGVDYLSEHFNENLDIDRLGTLCGISHAYFKRIFKRRFGMPPKAYLLSLRMKYACELLKTERCTVREIAEKVGYPNVYYFSTSFRKIVGLSPSDYRKSINK